MDNLLQVLRFLRRREDCASHELVLVCQDETDVEVEGFRGFHRISLNLPFYWKAKMCNTGVERASGDVICLLDSDRILPPNWFAEAANVVGPGAIATTTKLVRLTRPHSDDEIDAGPLDSYDEGRDPENRPMRRNAFSGNTVMLRDDYFRLGGLDEGYRGYGFCDNDATRKFQQNGFKIIWTNDLELHLHHETEVYTRDQTLKSFRIQTMLNGLRYFHKWKLPIPDDFLDLTRTLEGRQKLAVAERLKDMVASW